MSDREAEIRAKCHGHLRSFPPYVGGDDDEVDGWQGECMCGWKGRETEFSGVAQGELARHLNESISALRARLTACEQERDKWEQEYLAACKSLTKRVHQGANAVHRAKAAEARLVTAEEALREARNAGNALRLATAHAILVTTPAEVKMPRSDWDAIQEAAIDFIRVVVYPGERETEEDDRLFEESRSRIILAALTAEARTPGEHG